MPRRVPAILVVAACLLAGCGESPKERFVADGDTACRELAPRLEALEAGVSPEPRALLGVSSEYRELTRTLSARLAARPPAGDAGARRIVVAAAQLAAAARGQKVIAKRIVAADARRDRAARLRGYGAWWPALARMRDAHARPLDRAMRGYGFTGCRTENTLGLNY